MKTKYRHLNKRDIIRKYDQFRGLPRGPGDTFGKWVRVPFFEIGIRVSECVGKNYFAYRRPIKTARKQPTTRALLNAGGGKQSRPALRKARDVVQHACRTIL